MEQKKNHRTPTPKMSTRYWNLAKDKPLATRLFPNTGKSYYRTEGYILAENAMEALILDAKKPDIETRQLWLRAEIALFSYYFEQRPHTDLSGGVPSIQRIATRIADLKRQLADLDDIDIPPHRNGSNPRRW